MTPASGPRTTLLSTAELAAHLDDPDWVSIDCRFDLGDPARGEREYREGHVPGAVYAHLDRDLSSPPDGRAGRHPLPRWERLGATLGGWGIDERVQVVAYDQNSGMFASRLWWLLRALGHDAVAVLDGGLAKWSREGRPLRAGDESRAPRRFDGQPRPETMIDAAGVEHLLGRSDHRLIDARAPERYEGRVEPLDPVAGHIPGARNHFFERNLAPDGTFRSPAEIRDRLVAVLGPVPPGAVVCYCGSGVTACHDLLALEHAGLRGARLYPGSWSEWCSDPSRPVETGADRS